MTMRDVTRRRLNSLAKTAIVLLMLLVAAGLLTPAVLRVREAANLKFCANNLKQIGIAAHDYHSAFDRFPPGWYGPNPDSRDFLRASNHGVLLRIQPYFEADNTSNLFFLNHDVQARTDTQVDPVSGRTYHPPTDQPWWKLARPEDIKLYHKGDTEPYQILPAGTHSNYSWAMTRFKMLHCPSDDPYSSTEGTFVALHIYGPDAPKNFLQGYLFPFATTPSARELGRTNYVGVAGAAGRGGKNHISEWIPGHNKSEPWGVYEGVFYNRSTVTLGQIAVGDGASNTLMFGETLGGLEYGDAPARRYSFSWMCGALPTYYGLHGPDTGPWYAFSSRHRNVVQFARADGSVLGVRRGESTGLYTKDWWMLQDMAGVHDGGLRAVHYIPDEDGR